MIERRRQTPEPGGLTVAVTAEDIAETDAPARACERALDRVIVKPQYQSFVSDAGISVHRRADLVVLDSVWIPRDMERWLKLPPVPAVFVLGVSSTPAHYLLRESAIGAIAP